MSIADRYPYKPTVALLFMVYDQIDHEAIWDEWLRGHADKFHVFVHSKHPVRIGLKSVPVTVVPSIPTEWGTFSLVEAQVQLLNHALDRHSAMKFVFLSNSCIPVKEVDVVYDELISTYPSNILLSNPTQVFPRYDAVKLPEKDNIVKHSQWTILNRPHASYITMHLKTMRDAYADVIIPDESAFGTFIKIGYGFEGQVDTTRPTTAVDWEHGDPSYYHDISSRTLAHLINQSPSLFARKFHPHCTVDDTQSLLTFLRREEVL